MSRPPDRTPSDRIETPKSPRTSMDKAHGRSRMSETFSRISSPPTVPTRTISSGRPRRTSFNDAQGLRVEDIGRAPITENELPPIPPLSAPFALPPPVAEPVLGLAGDDGIVKPAVFSPSDSQISTPPPVPLARPAALRRALSDYSTPHAAPPSQLHRTSSVTTELGKLPESSVLKDSPSTSIAVATPPSPEDQDEDSALDLSDLYSGENGTVNIVDEGDVLPTGDFQMDITFDDEGLNALERIFLLSQSDFGFHRAYVARVVGDLLEDVDPCESVEYVLPLLSGYSMDEDDLVKEAFSAQLHKILWYFFSTCRLISEPGETVTITSEGMSSVTKPEQDAPAIPLAIDPGRRASLASTGGASNGGGSSGGPSSGSCSSGGLSSTGSSLTNPPSSVFDSSDVDTINTPNSITSVSSDATAFSPLPYVDVHAEGSSAKEPSELVAQPELLINTFTPLLGNMMLSTNPVVGENTRSAVIAVIGRLRGVVDAEKWARVQGDRDERKAFVSQGGVHAHDLRPFHADSKSMVESELLSGIVLGMGHLSSELPDNYDETAIDEMPEEAEGYRIQLVQEAEAGRAISMFLIGSLCDIYTGPEASKRGFVPEVLGAVDGDETTRTEAAVALSRMAKIVPIEHVPQMVSLTCIASANFQLPVFELFVHDEIELVRQAVAVALPALVKRIESLEDRRSVAVDGLKSLYSAGDGCRCAAMEVLGELIHAFYDDPLGPPVELVNTYKDDSNEEEVFPGDCDWDIIAAYNVCLASQVGADN
jgi:serine/threonine-protein phosphatase 4 regulatory subunit 1